jgi:hypothetical protein
LERKFPNKWGRVNRTEISGPDGAPVKVDIDAKEALQAKLTEMLERAEKNAELLNNADDD